MKQNPPANSYDEWSRLREVVVGRADHYTEHHTDSSWMLFYFENVAPVLGDTAAERDLLSIPAQLVDELNEDIAGLVDTLTGCGVTVLRPAAPGKDVDIRSPYWDARATPPLNVRDQSIVLGKTIVETAPHIRARLFENDLLKPIFYRYYEQGGNWLSMPRPALAAGSLDDAYFRRRGVDVSTATSAETAQPIDGLGLEMVFDGAQCIRLGRDVLVNVANTNHDLALRWLRDNFPQLCFHRLDAMADNHIDSIIVPLRPGLMMLRSPQYLPYLPQALRSWDVIYPPPMSGPEPDYGDFGFVIPTASRYIDINVLSIDETTVVVNSHYPELIRVLEQRGFTVAPVRHRHRRLFGGGFHCFTLDTVRDGGCEDYLT
ncbi:glycine amidinotransferase [Actinoplanes sichuanensis]|uniref:Glycine amidinotransferase n=1 Tax=Actinoplanes sichuanensis TaxID=512349 RepID=A0ABW4A366_9ACTN|nr:glycine amidinotransferase [Actinoplanes sichuanensis]BEL05753.1 glycine amidinotransferase [Actinoplanes sichuanensis]